MAKQANTKQQQGNGNGKPKQLSPRDEVRYLLKARHTLIWIQTEEERRVEQTLASVAEDIGYEYRVWDCATGCMDRDGAKVEPPLLPHEVQEKQANPSMELEVQTDPTTMCERIKHRTAAQLWVFRDLHAWLKEDPLCIRSYKSLARELQDDRNVNRLASMVVVSPSADVPLELQSSAVVVSWPLANRKEIKKILKDTVEASGVELAEGKEEAIVEAATGLTSEDMANAFARSIVQENTIDPHIVSEEKKRLVSRGHGLTWHDPDPRGLNAVGGLENLKTWLVRRRLAFSQQARAYGLPLPKGVLLLGVPGCGKSLTAKAVATAWEVPLLQIDMGGLKSKYVGESETNVRNALKVAEAVAPAILWLDEIEKALAGARGPQGDGGVSADALAKLLTWQQEREGGVFLIATANDVTMLPPELLRKGRFDDIFYIDLPTAQERRAILEVSIKQFKRNPADFDLADVVEASEGFTGAEIADLVTQALFAAFHDNMRQPTEDDLLVAAAETMPMSQARPEDIAAVRAWARRARPASAAGEMVPLEALKAEDAEGATSANNEDAA